jgi:hypothetical protein
VWQGFINVSESFSYKDSLAILATQRKKGWWYLMTNVFLLFSFMFWLIKLCFELGSMACLDQVMGFTV